MKTELLSILLLTLFSCGSAQQKPKQIDEESTKHLTQQLDSIILDDQRYRITIDSIGKMFGYESKEMTFLEILTQHQDSINFRKISLILDKYGWLGPDDIGARGYSTIFLVIQHSDIKSQEKYLPMIKEAFKIGKVRPGHIALLIDRVEMGNGRPQIYGTQSTITGGKYAIYPIIDEMNLNKRRSEIGLEPLQNYPKNRNIENNLPDK